MQPPPVMRERTVGGFPPSFLVAAEPLVGLQPRTGDLRVEVDDLVPAVPVALPDVRPTPASLHLEGADLVRVFVGAGAERERDAVCLEATALGLLAALYGAAGLGLTHLGLPLPDLALHVALGRRLVLGGTRRPGRGPVGPDLTADEVVHARELYDHRRDQQEHAEDQHTGEPRPAPAPILVLGLGLCGHLGITSLIALLEGRPAHPIDEGCCPRELRVEIPIERGFSTFQSPVLFPKHDGNRIRIGHLTLPGKKLAPPQRGMRLCFWF